MVTTMRLIDADALENRVRPVKNFDNPESLVVVLGAIRCQPTIDAVPVVRCGECKHRDPEDKKCDSGDLERVGCIFPVDDDYFCKYGER